MPEMTFTVQWPDGRVQQCYSPSLVMHDHLEAGSAYPVAEFVAASTRALDEAAERVRARYGFACTSAMAQRDELQALAGRYPDGGLVRVLAMHPPLPAEVSTSTAPTSTALTSAAPTSAVPSSAAPTNAATVPVRR